MNHYKLEEMYQGMKKSFEREITEGMMQKFMQITGDENPLHVDREYALEKGFSDRVVYGMLTASFYSTLVGMYLPGEHCLFHEIRDRFIKPVYIGDVLVIEGTVTDIREGTGRIKIKGEIFNQKRELVNESVLTVGFTN